jgi:transcription elongation factor Elf1
MDQLMAQCPMRDCGHKTRVCTLRSEAMPTFDPGIYVVVKCSNCGQEFRELATRLVSAYSINCDNRHANRWSDRPTEAV